MTVDHDLIEQRLKALEWRVTQLEAERDVTTKELVCRHDFLACSNATGDYWACRFCGLRGPYQSVRLGGNY